MKWWEESDSNLEFHGPADNEQKDDGMNEKTKGGGAAGGGVGDFTNDGPEYLLNELIGIGVNDE
jgi:hypothetical protein